MKDYLTVHPWKIIEDGFHPEYNKVSESIFSLGNGKMGQRGNFEEYFSGETLQGNYIGGVYYPDKTRVGWWKIGYPEYYAKVLNSANWNQIDLFFNEQRIDLGKNKILSFQRVLDMHSGVLSRSCVLELEDLSQIKIESKRLNSLLEKELGCIQYKITVIKGQGECQIASSVDFDVRNEDSNYDENFWHQHDTDLDQHLLYIEATTKKTNFTVGIAQHTLIEKNGEEVSLITGVNANTTISHSIVDKYEEGDVFVIEKSAAILSTFNHSKEKLKINAYKLAQTASQNGFAYYESTQKQEWMKKWADIDIEIKGDDKAQQGIRFNIFQLHQTYSGDDYRLNIGPKGFTGERYGGSTYWDTEAYCLPFYMSTAEPSVGKALLIYRYKQLSKAIENAEKLGFKNGAALFPMVTMNGEECHNEWEITFEEIHRNGAIAYAIYNYIRYSGDNAYLSRYGLEVLIAISRFWAQRVHYSTFRKKFVMLGVTGPNEYENNVNNNWYTNYIATWTLKYTLSALEYVSKEFPDKYNFIIEKIKFNSAKETGRWISIIEQMYYPESEELGIFLQQDNYLDKEQILVEDLPKHHLPLNQNWSWDRILRSCFIKQADVLQGLFFFEEEFDKETVRKNFLFYEPRTVHESSLSPCVHSILASKLGMEDKAYEMYLRTARLDLNDYNNDTEDGLHITSMAGTWMSVVKGFGGMTVKDGILFFNPTLPQNWEGYNFKIKYRRSVLRINVLKNEWAVENMGQRNVKIGMGETIEFLPAGSTLTMETQNII